MSFVFPTPERVASTAVLAVAAVLVHTLVLAVAAQGASVDEAGAVVIFPLVETDTPNGRDTLLRLSNASSTDTDLHCFYENVTGHCLGSPAICRVDADCGATVCIPGYSVADFLIRLIPGQPVEWRASQGLAVLPTPGNQGVILPVAEDPFIGILRCIVIDPLTGLPPVPGGPATDVLEGTATIEDLGAANLTVARYRAIGFTSLGNDGDRSLVFGEEYAGCPNVLILNNLFEDSLEPVDGGTRVSTDLVLAPCAVDYELSVPAGGVLQYIVFNEFEQRTRLNSRFTAHVSASLAEIHPTVFDVAVQGSLAGQVRIQAVGPGVVGFARRVLSDGLTPLATPAFALRHVGNRPDVDVVTLPQP